ncbi:alpha/beta fold hydrolase [Mycobacterium sp. BMJ-28]
MTPAEQFTSVGAGIRLCYQRFGDPHHPTVVLIAGLGQQLHSWPTPLVEVLADRRFSVVRFDNRDAGRSTHMEYPPPNPIAMFRGGDRRLQYRLADMAQDVAGLLDTLDVSAAHLVGMSMGAMIAQTVAARFPLRTRTLTSIMSTTGAPRLGRPAWSTWARMLTTRPPRTREEAVAQAVAMNRHIGSHGYPFDAGDAARVAAVEWDRDNRSAEGATRQLAAIFASADRTAELRTIAAPTLVIHGDRDRMVHPSGGAATAAAIRSARLMTITGMGHDLAVGARPALLDLLVTHLDTNRVSERHL